MVNLTLKQDATGVHATWTRLRQLMQARIRSLENKMATMSAAAKSDLCLPCVDAVPVRVGSTVAYDMTGQGQTVRIPLDLRAEAPQKSVATAFAEQSVVLIRLSASEPMRE